MIRAPYTYEHQRGHEYTISKKEDILYRRVRQLFIVGLFVVLSGLVVLSGTGAALGQPVSASSRAQQEQQPPQTVVAVQCAKHKEVTPHFDRVVIEINGTTPNFLVIQYVKQLLAQGSGKVIPVKGKNILLVTFSPGHIFQNGKPTIPTRVKCNLPLVTEVVNNGEFEATVGFGIGIRPKEKPEYRVQLLTSPTRIVVDFVYDD